MNSIIKTNNFDSNAVTFSMNVDKTTKRKMFFVNHDKKAVLIKTPKMYFPNGLKHWKSDAYADSFELEASFGDDPKDPQNELEIKDFHEKMKALDEMIKNEILKNPKDWIGKSKTSMEMIEESYYPNPIVRVPRDSDGNILEYNEKIKIKLDRERVGDTYTGYFSSNNRERTRVMVFDQENNNLDITEENCESVIPKGTTGNLLIQFVNINIVGDKVYPKWKLIQAKISRNRGMRIDTNVFEDDVADTVEEFKDLDVLDDKDVLDDAPELAKPKKSKKPHVH